MIARAAIYEIITTKNSNCGAAVIYQRLVKLLGYTLLLAAASLAMAQLPSYSKPKVRAITGFVRLDRAHYAEQIAATLAVLRAASDEFTSQGYEVETLRVVTQPLGGLVAGLSDDEALAYLADLDKLGAKEHFIPNVGPAMLRDGDDPRAIHILARALSTLTNINASAIIAGEDGIHWKVIHESAALVRYLTDHSPQSQGNFSFTASAMLKPYGPFYPGAWHDGAGKQFSIGLEGANVVKEVFSRTHGDFAGSVAELTKQLTVHAKAAESVGNHIAASSGWAFLGVDPT